MGKPTESALSPKQITRFYEPIIVCEVLSAGVCKLEATASSTREASSQSIELSEKEKFHKFVYKLAYICAFQKGPNTVTSFAVLQNNQTGQIILTFAANQITSEEGLKVMSWVKSILSVVYLMDRLRGRERVEVRRAVLKAILSRNRARAGVYLESQHLPSHVQRCLEHDFSKSSGERLESKLVALQGCIPADYEGKNSSKDGYVQICVGVIDIINQLDSADFRQIGDLLKSQIKGSQDFEAWSGLLHCISRLKAYDQAVDELVKARKAWPEIFQMDKVIIEHIPSSTRAPKPVGKKSADIFSCIGRMTSDQTIMAQFRDLAASLQKFELNKRMQAHCENQSFRPFVHSEVLVYDWISNKYSGLEFEYFRGWKYIGASKPTCKLCDYFFDAVDDHVERRPTHGNYYVIWRLPDGYGAGFNDKGASVYFAMIERVRSEAFKLVSEKSGIRKKHDSETYTCWTTRKAETVTESARASDGGVETMDLSSRLARQLNLVDDNESVRGQASVFGAD